MKLDASDLREIADTLDKISEAKLQVDVVTVRGHKVMIKRSDSQFDGLSYHVLGITDGELAGHAGKVMRDAEAESGKPDTSDLAGGKPRRGSGYR